MKDYVLDTSALLTLRDDEPGADRVAAILSAAAAGKVRCHGCFMTRMELLYRVWKDEGEAEGRLAYEQSASLPINWQGESEDMLLRAAEIKANNAVSVADAWIAACAQMLGATLIHKDPEFIPLAIDQDPLPMKQLSRNR
jgi:predicted nucleic acid-binding protein